jgi:hypothetical protein
LETWVAWALRGYVHFNSWFTLTNPLDFQVELGEHEVCLSRSCLSVYFENLCLCYDYSTLHFLWSELQNGGQRDGVLYMRCIRPDCSWSYGCRSAFVKKLHHTSTPAQLLARRRFGGNESMQELGSLAVSQRWATEGWEVWNLLACKCGWLLFIALWFPFFFFSKFIEWINGQE